MVDENSQNTAPQAEEQNATPAETNAEAPAAPVTPEAPAEQTQETAPESTAAPAPEAQAPAEEKVETTSEERTLAAIGYLPLLGFISVTLKPDSKYCSHHGNQGIVITILWFVVILWLAFEQYTGSLAFLALFALTAIGMFRGFKGDMWNIPIISQVASKINLGGTMKAATGVEKPATEEPKKEEEKPVETPAPEAPATPEEKPAENTENQEPPAA